MFTPEYSMNINLYSLLLIESVQVPIARKKADVLCLICVVATFVAVTYPTKIRKIRYYTRFGKK